MYKMCKVLVTQERGIFVEGLLFYQTDIAQMVYIRKFVRQGAHSGNLPENLALPRGQI